MGKKTNWGFIGGIWMCVWVYVWALWSFMMMPDDLLPLSSFWKWAVWWFLFALFGFVLLWHVGIRSWLATIRYWRKRGDEEKTYKEAWDREQYDQTRIAKTRKGKIKRRTKSKSSRR